MASELVQELEFLVSLNKPDKGGPYGGFAAAKCIDAMRRAATLLSSQEAEIERLKRQVWWTDAQIDRAARHLRETLQSGKKLSSWETTPNSTKKKWLTLAKGTLAAAMLQAFGSPETPEGGQ